MIVTLLAAAGLAGCSCGDPPPPRDEARECDLDADPCAPACPVLCTLCPWDPACPVCATPARSCDRDADCAPLGDLRCEEHCCVPACSTDLDCVGREGCAGVLGCWCGDLGCEPTACSADAECPDTMACHRGTCVPAGGEPSSCSIDPAVVALRPGDAAELKVWLEDAEGGPVREAVALLSTAPDVATFDPATAAVVGGSTRGTTTLRASVGIEGCSATVINVGALVADTFRVVVVDEQTGLPVSGAQVQVEPGTLLASTDELGVASLQTASWPATDRVIGVFHAEYDFTTIGGARGTDLIIPVRRREPPDRIGGFAGIPEWDGFVNTNVHVALGGASVPLVPRELAAKRILGPVDEVVFEIGGPRERPLAEGAGVGLGAKWFREGFTGRAVPSCSPPDECGVRDVWALGASFPFWAFEHVEDFEHDRLTPWPELVTSLLIDDERRWQGGLSRRVEFEVAPAVADQANGGFDPDPGALAEVSVQLTAPSSLRTRVCAPELPEAGARDVGAFVVVGTPGALGWVPLGVRTARRTASGFLDNRSENAAGCVALRHPPAWGGAAGDGYLVFVSTMTAAALGELPVCAPGQTADCARESVLLRFLPALPVRAEVRLEGPFLPFEDGARYAQGTRELAAGAGGAGLLRRLEITHADGVRWNVLAPADLSFALPAPPPVAADRPDRGWGVAVQQVLDAPLTVDDALGYGAPPWSRLMRSTTRMATTGLP